MPFDQRSLIHWKVLFPQGSVRQNQQNQQKCLNLRSLLSIIFPQGFRISKNIGHLTLGSGGKKTLKRYLKSEQTHRRTDRRTFQFIESIGDALKRPKIYKILIHISTFYNNIIKTKFIHIGGPFPCCRPSARLCTPYVNKS